MTNVKGLLVASAIILKILGGVVLLIPAPAQAWVDSPRCVDSMLGTASNYPPDISSCDDLVSYQPAKDAAYDIVDACVLSLVNSLSDQVNSLIVLMEDLVFVPDEVTGGRVATTILSVDGAVNKVAGAAVSFAKGSVSHVQTCAGEGISSTLERNLKTFKSFQEVVKASESLHTDLTSVVISGATGSHIELDDIAVIKELRSKLSSYSQHLDNLAADVEAVGFSLVGPDVEDEINLRRSQERVQAALSRVAEPGVVDSPGECRLETLDSAIRSAQKELATHRWFVLTRREYYSTAYNCLKDGKYPSPQITQWLSSRTTEMLTRFTNEIEPTRDRFAQIDRACRQLDSAVPAIRSRGDALKARLDQSVRAAVSCDLDAARASIAGVADALNQSRCLSNSSLWYAYLQAEQQIQANADGCSGTILVGDDDLNTGNLPPTVDPNRYYWYVIRKQSSGTWHWNNYRCVLTDHEPIQLTPIAFDDEIARRRKRWDAYNRECKSQGCDRGASFSRIWRPETWSFDVIMGPLNTLPRDEIPKDDKKCTGSLTN